MRGGNSGPTRADRRRFFRGLRLTMVCTLAACRSHPTLEPEAVAANRPAVVLVSLDGFRPDYLDRGRSPALTALARDGVRAQALVPVFPTKTFPNHYTIVTGLTPARHGIVGNEFSAPAVGSFSMHDRDAVADPRFWLGEPIWVTAERQGLRTAPYFWPGSEAAIGGVRPSWWAAYDHQASDSLRVKRILDLLALPPGRRPSFLTLYLSHVDQAGHEYGPDSPEVDGAIARVDAVFGSLVAGLARRGLAGRVNLVVVSDHGMAATSATRIVWLDDHVRRHWLQVDALSPVLMARPQPGMEDSLLLGLEAAPHLTVYRRAALPARWGLDTSPRVAPVVAVAEEGWTIAWRPSPGDPPVEPSLGDHGYDAALPCMAAIFVAGGPGFRRGVTVPAFANIHLYPMLAALLGIVPALTEGSLDSVRAVLAHRSSEPARQAVSPRAPAAPERSSDAPAPR